MLRYKLRTLLIILAIGPPLLAFLWFTVNLPYGPAVLAAEVVLLLIIALPIAILAMLAERRRYLLERDRHDRRGSGLFSDDWPSPN